MEVSSALRPGEAMNRPSHNKLFKFSALSMRGLLVAASAMCLSAALIGCAAVKPVEDPTPAAPVEGGAGDQGDSPVGEEPAASDSGLGEPGEEGDREAPERPEDGGVGQVNVSASAEAALGRALSAIDKGRFEEARSELEPLLGDSDAAFLAQYNLGVLADRQAKVEEALAAFGEALRLNPDFSPALVSLCRLHLRMGRAPLALQTADRYIRERPDNLGHVDARLQVLLYTQRYEDVLRDAKLVLKRDERNVQAMVNMAAAYSSLGKHELAEDVLLQVEQVATSRMVQADVRYRLGFVYLAMERSKAALTSFETAVNKRPDFAEARNNLGVLYHKARDFDAAVTQFQKAVSVQPRYKEAHLNLGNAYKGMKSYAEAEQSFQDAMRIDGNYAAAYFNLGILYLDATFEDGRDRKEQFQLAIDNFNRYKLEMKSELPREDPADRYIEEAKKKIDLEIRREEQMREAELEAESDEGLEELEGGDDEFEEFPAEGEGGAEEEMEFQEFPAEGDEGVDDGGEEEMEFQEYPAEGGEDVDDGGEEEMEFKEYPEEGGSEDDIDDR